MLGRRDLAVLCNIREDWYWIFTLLMVMFCCYFFYMCYRSLIKYKAIEDTPTSKIRSATQGYVELMGTQLPCKVEPVVARLSHKPCTWYRYQIEFWNKDKRWQVIEAAESPGLFMMTDGTGTCYIDPAGADISSPIVDCWNGRSRYPSNIPQGFWAKLFSGGGRYRYTEMRMEQEMPIYAAGNFLTLRKTHIEAQTHNKQIDGLVGAWKTNHHPVLTALFNPATMTSATKAPTKRTDKPKEAKELLSPTVNVLSGYGLDKRHPFVISGHAERKLVKKYRFDAITWGIAFVIVFALTAFLVHLRLSC